MRFLALLAGRNIELGTDLWCVSWKLYHPDGTAMPHDQGPTDRPSTLQLEMGVGSPPHGSVIVGGVLRTMNDWVVETVLGQLSKNASTYHWIVPVDDCYRMIALVRREWRGSSPDNS